MFNHSSFFWIIHRTFLPGEFACIHFFVGIYVTGVSWLTFSFVFVQVAFALSKGLFIMLRTGLIKSRVWMSIYCLIFGTTASIPDLLLGTCSLLPWWLGPEAWGKFQLAVWIRIGTQVESEQWEGPKSVCSGKTRRDGMASVDISFKYADCKVPDSVKSGIYWVPKGIWVHGINNRGQNG